MRNPELWKKPESTAIMLSEGTAMPGVSHVTETAGYLTAYTRFLFVTAVSGETLRPDIRAEAVWHQHRQDDVAQIACHHGCLVK